MKKLLLLLSVCLVLIFFSFGKKETANTWIRINQLGYTPAGIKVAVWCSKVEETTKTFQLIDSATGKNVFTGKLSECFGKYGPFSHTTRLNFSSFKKPGKYYLKIDEIISPVFRIDDEVYKGTADFCLRYMRQQRSGFNPFLKDSCHTHDGYTLYGEKAGLKDSTHLDATGGWHDASDYLQYSSTSANATYHLLAAYRDFPNVFTDEKQTNGLNGKNKIADVLDEAKWGLNWLLKMHPKPEYMFNQLGDDRDHMGMRIPKEDTNFYGKGLERPIYFINGEPQQRGKFVNDTKGTSSTAAKFSSAFSLGAQVFEISDPRFATTLSSKSVSAWEFALIKKGVTQTASVRSPYIYAEDNWVDDMELAAARFFTSTKKNEWLTTSMAYADAEKITPWLGNDTAAHYQWYPFINLGHYELAKQLKGDQQKKVISFYKEGIEKVWNKAKDNAFYRGIPFIWCSNNLTTSFAIQCYWYRTLTKDQSFSELEQANFDWLFGCNPWGTSMVYGLPSWGDTPTDPHSAFTHLKNYPIDGGLIDGPVYTSIYSKLIGITLYQPDEYAHVQSDLAVYHDDYGDYSTNEPTMDGTASLIYLLAAKENEFLPVKKKALTISNGGIIRGDSTQQKIALVFTADEFGEGLNYVSNVLDEKNIKASFFFTGRFYRNKTFQPQIKKLFSRGNYMGPHSDQHLLYNDWMKRDSLLVTKKEFENDLDANIASMKELGVIYKQPKYFIPPYEWWNDSIATWSASKQMTLFSFTPGTSTNADYTWPELGKQYKTSAQIFEQVQLLQNIRAGKLNGMIILLHVGTDPRRTDKFYKQLPVFIAFLQKNKYQLVTIEKLLQ
jgi:endoglucanase